MECRVDGVIVGLDGYFSTVAAHGSPVLVTGIYCPGGRVTTWDFGMTQLAVARPAAVSFG